MFTEIGSEIKVVNPSDELVKWCKANLELDNPEYAKKVRMNLWTGKTPKTLYLYSWEANNTLVIPFGCLRSLMPYINGKVVKTFQPADKLDFGGEVALYDYQKDAVEDMYHHHYGILQSPAGSGKTQMGIALAAEIGARTLWLTHTKDLLDQSMKRAEQYLDSSKFGTITEGKVNIGDTMTFATIQTMCRIDLNKYKDMWDCIIVDECHRVSGTPTAMTQFSQVLNSLRARHKYGLSATVHRADGLIKATYALLGEIVHTVPDEAVADMVMKVDVYPIPLAYATICSDWLNTDGTTNYAKLITYLTENENRNLAIQNQMVVNTNHYNLILSERVSHLYKLYEGLPKYLKEWAAVIDGKTPKAKREKAIQDMRDGKLIYLFATYALCKEGLDIPRLDRLYLATPQKDYAVIVQSVGRVRRKFEGKKTPIVYDFVDFNIRNLLKAYKKRCSHYRKCGCLIQD